jgi:peptide deformylase
VARPVTVAVRGTTPEGATRLVEADAIEARALLHELDHLDGLLFLDRVVSTSTDLFRRRRYR